MENLEAALSLVNKMTVAERKQLLDHLALGMQVSKKESGKINRDLDMWLSAVVDALDSILKTGGTSVPSLGVVKRLHSAQWPPVEQFMIGSKLMEMKVLERQAVYKLLAKLLVDHAHYVAKKSGAPLSTKLVFNCINNLPGLFDGAFPGYLACGMAKAVILPNLRV